MARFRVVQQWLTNQQLRLVVRYRNGFIEPLCRYLRKDPARLPTRILQARAVDCVVSATGWNYLLILSKRLCSRFWPSYGVQLSYERQAHAFGYGPLRAQREAAPRRSWSALPSWAAEREAVWLCQFLSQSPVGVIRAGLPSAASPVVTTFRDILGAQQPRAGEK
jgi:hypothetical protein